MDSNTHQTVEINLKDLFFVLLKRAGAALLAGVVFAGILFGYKYFVGVNDANILDTSVRLEGESDTKYSERVLNVNRAEDIIDSIDVLNGQIENQREYLANSILMQIDATNEAVTSSQIVITIADNSMSGIDRALISSYSQALKSGDYLDELANDLGTEQEYLKETIKVEYEVYTSVVVNAESASGSVVAFSITVVGPTTEYTDAVMDCVLGELNSVYADLNDNMVPHTLSLTNRQSFYMVDDDTRDLQNSAANRFGVLQRQIDNYDDSLDKLSSEIGVESKDSLYAYFSFDDTDAGKLGSTSEVALKYAIVGFAFGFIAVLAYVFVDYVFGKKFVTQTKFAGKFTLTNKVKLIGVAKPKGKRSAYAKFIDRKTGDDNMLTEDNNNKLIAANVKNLTSGMNKVLFTGTAEATKIKELVESLNLKVDVKDSIFEDPSCLESVSDYDGVVIVEQRNYSDCRMIDKELDFITNADAKLIGVIVI